MKPKKKKPEPVARYMRSWVIHRDGTTTAWSPAFKVNLYGKILKTTK